MISMPDELALPPQPPAPPALSTSSEPTAAPEIPLAYPAEHQAVLTPVDLAAPAEVKSAEAEKSAAPESDE